MQVRPHLLCGVSGQPTAKRVGLGRREVRISPHVGSIKTQKGSHASSSSSSSGC